ncbi:AAA domain-containing protein [Fusarium keratoplasticum]|uniref:AAA domain-containing protein n=1 Tax=Fusarium keratoplasticum TaxID=1328300 RepID=A0ACC0R8X7_9HYPO|nr:AAA domain-containing protein [Fusarium keratoplasticum]KAI8675905.1 AAA domain-containing protein [Fusarium keratoplasticum]
MDDLNRQGAEPVRALSETTTNQPPEPANIECHLEPVPGISGEIRALAGALGAALEGTELSNEQPRGQNPVNETSKEAPWHHRVTPADLTGGLTYEWLKDVTSRLTTLEGSQGKDEAKEVGAKDEMDMTESMKTEPKVRDCNWEQFKNRYSPEECTYAIEVLLTGDDLDGEMEEEQLRRLTLEKRRKFLESNQKKPARRPQADKRPDKNRLERVRINSPAILSFISGVTGETSWAEKPHTFLRPFKTLIHYHERLEEEFGKLKARFEDNGPPNQEPSLESVELPKTNAAEDLTTSVTDGLGEAMKEQKESGKESNFTVKSPKPTTESTKGEPPMKDNNTTSQREPRHIQGDNVTEAGYKEIKCYMEFSRSRILPVYRKFEDKDHRQRVKVRFDDLWSLFRTGELVFKLNDSQNNSLTTEDEKTLTSAGRKRGQKLWRVYYVESDNTPWTVDNLEAEKGNFRRNSVDKIEDFDLRIYYIDYDGMSYSSVGRQWTLPRFEGDMDVTKLQFYPVRFEKDYEATISKLAESGLRFQKLLLSAAPAVQHDGWTLTHDPVGDQLSDQATKTAEYIESDVIIDFHEAYQTNPSWKPPYLTFVKSIFEPETKYDEFAIMQWSGPDRSRAITKLTEVVVSFEDVGALRYNKFIKDDSFAMDPDARPAESRQARRELAGQDLSLLTSRMFVYSLRNRKFIHADVQNLKPIEVMSDPFSDLKIEEPHKRLIRSVVQDHFDKKSIQRQLRARDIEPLEQDFIRGKGKGLVIMLHGAPGVGKTATAEAVAATHRKPLFAITCGDLGIDPREVESTLSEIFRLANLWDCILLLDEAEIFLSRREKKDDNLQRNALVSIFLRTLEYYPGILFLTTNRVGVLDEALNSRVHVSIYFRHLDAEQTMALFDMNLKRSEMIAEQRATSTKEAPLLIKAEEIRGFALTHFAKHAGGPGGLGTWWNGRQIRNAFQIATSLAYADARDQKNDENRYLGRKHFDQVLQAMEEYTQYRQDLLHKTDDDLAADREERYARVGGENSGRRESPRYGPVYSDYSRPRSFQHQRPSYPTSPSSARPFAGREGEYVRQDPDTPTPQRQEPFLAPGAYPAGLGGGDRPMSRGEFHDQGREYGRPGRQM